MPKTEIKVTLTLKEMQDAVIEEARKEAGSNAGGSRLEFTYGDAEAESPTGAVVYFQRKSQL